MNGVRFTARAEADLEAIHEYVARDNPKAAAELIDLLEASLATYAEHPEAGRRRYELRPGLRSIPVGNYLLFYRQGEDGIEVIRVLHSARDVAALF